LIDGSIQPIFGVIFSKMIGFLSKPVDEYIGYGGVSAAELEEDISLWALLMTAAALVLGIGACTQKTSFGTLGNNVTLEVRKLLYSNVMQKNIGWFDDRENTPSVLTTIIASDTAVVNGVSSESLGP
jgi:ATP-binding cassette subfamily B (MDR/TAP) protein 1